MDTVDNKNIIKLIAIVAVAYVMYRVYVSRNENFQQTPYSTIAQEATGLPTPPMYMPPMSVATDLLPKPTAALDDFTQYASNGNLQGMSFLEPSALIGVDTVGSSKRNPNLQIRADPPCPRSSGPPGPVSDIEPDRWRKPLDDCY